MLGHFICNSTCDAPKLCAEIIIILLGVEKIVGILMNGGTVWGGGGSYVEKMLWKLRGDNCLVGWFTEVCLLKMRAAGAMVSPRDDGELASPRRGEANRNAKLYPSKFFFFFFFFCFFFAPCEICFRNLGVVRSSILIFHSAKQNSNDISAKCPTSVSTF